MSSKTGVKTRKKPQHKPSKKVPRTPRTLVVDSNKRANLPAIIPESFSPKGFDLFGKIEDMRNLTKELAVMAKQIEQWMGVAHTIGLAFKDNGVLKDVLSALVNISSGNKEVQSRPQKSTQSPKKERKSFPPPFPFFNQENDDEDIDYEPDRSNSGKKPFDGLNFMEIISNPAFQEIMSKLFLQKK